MRRDRTRQCYRSPPGASLLGVACETPLVAQVQIFQMVQFPQFRQQRAVEGVYGSTSKHPNSIRRRTQRRYTPVRIELHERTHHGSRYRAHFDNPKGGNLELHRGRFGGQEGLTEPVAVQNLEDSAVVGGRYRAPNGVQRVGQVSHPLHMVVVHIVHGPIGIHP